jgi:hypothetical protein
MITNVNATELALGYHCEHTHAPHGNEKELINPCTLRVVPTLEAYW